MATYAWRRSNFALDTAADAMTFITASARRLDIVEVCVSGLGIASAQNEVKVTRSTGGTTGGGAITAAKMIEDAPSAATVVDTTWSAQPTHTGTGLLALGCNANGGIFRWVARPGEEINARNAEQISIRSAVGTSTVSLHVIGDET